MTVTVNEKKDVLLREEDDHLSIESLVIEEDNLINDLGDNNGLAKLQDTI